MTILNILYLKCLDFYAICTIISWNQKEFLLISWVTVQRIQMLSEDGRLYVNRNVTMNLCFHFLIFFLSYQVIIFPNLIELFYLMLRFLKPVHLWYKIMFPLTLTPYLFPYVLLNPQMLIIHLSLILLSVLIIIF